MLSIDLTKGELGSLVKGYYTETTLNKLIEIDFSDCQRWEESQNFRRFVTEVVGTTPGHWKAPKAIQSWAVELLMKHREKEAMWRQMQLAGREKIIADLIAEKEAAEKEYAAKYGAKIAAKLKASGERDDARRAAKAAAEKEAAIAKAASLMITRAANEAVAIEAAKESAARAASDICFDGDDLLSFD
ncbi:hypothetical protein FLAG1_06254 [Fusarium langsethiae]|uniref:Uncharacterized protein n=1 Tax=Fusarium langsethiae TaxID=179993 RepID=A0A0M9EVN5_FUSLA|nr:hypothetical protein FLAG1_06254 [Fusarium langsethiae]GKU03665.1 unnamed protein product [Fusarium langsethiae]GKU20404.1 unnamed protein product [Fusarium langsethiae]